MLPHVVKSVYAVYIYSYTHLKKSEVVGRLAGAIFRNNNQPRAIIFHRFVAKTARNTATSV